MTGTPRFNDPAKTTAKITLVVPMDIDRQLQTCAGREGSLVGADDS
jgi:hypothetical protein